MLDPLRPVVPESDSAGRFDAQSCLIEGPDLIDRHRPVRVLYLTDDAGDVDRLRAWLPAGFAVDGAGPADAPAALDGHDVLLVDGRSTRDGQLGLLDLGRPAVVLTGADDWPAARAAGAADCVTDDELTPGLLSRVLRHAAERQRQRAARDARERKHTAALGRARAARRRSEERLAAVYDAAPVGLCETDLDGRFLRANPRFCQLAGRPEDALVGQPFTAITHPDDAAADEALFRRLLAGEIPSYALEKRYLQPGGHAVWVSLTCAAVRDAAGRPLYTVRVVQDATARKLAEEALREGYRRLRGEQARRDAVLAQLPAGVVLCDAPSGAAVYGNAMSRQILGDRLPGPADWPIRDACGERHAPDRLPVARALRGEVVTGEEVQLPRPDGTVGWLSLNAAPIREADGRIVAAVVAFEDITGRKRAEEGLREASRRKDEFLAMLGHELRNPLAPIRNALEVLRLRSDLETVTWAVDISRRQIGHLSRLVDDLLDVSRIIRGKIRLQPGRLDLAALARAAAEDHRAAVGDARLTLDVRLPDGPVWVAGDATRLSQVIGNLLTNATKFTDPGGRVTLSLEVDGRRAVVRVADTGIGIEAAMLARLFDPFAQADRSLDRCRGGLGLGLALVKGLAELHGGGVAADSAGPGRGAEFRVWLPLDAPVSTPAPAAPAQVTAGAARQLRILVVEDSTDAAESLRLLLEQYGHSVTVAHTGTAGLTLARSCRPDLILSDLGLPGLDGFALARALRDDPALAHIPLLAHSGYAQDEDKQRARDAGYCHHFTKPVDPAELARVLADVGAAVVERDEGDGEPSPAADFMPAIPSPEGA